MKSMVDTWKEDLSKTPRREFPDLSQKVKQIRKDIEVKQIRKDIGLQLAKSLEDGDLEAASIHMRDMAYTYSHRFVPIHYKYVKLVRNITGTMSTNLEKVILDSKQDNILASPRRRSVSYTPIVTTVQNNNHTTDFNFQSMYPNSVVIPIDTSSIYPDNILGG